LTPVGVVLPLLAASGMAGACGGARVMRTPPAAPPLSDAMATFDSAWGIIARTYWDTTYNGVNWRAVRDTLRPRAAAARSTPELRGVLSDMLGRLGQSHFAIIPREAVDGDAADASVRGDASPGITVRWVDGAPIVWRVDPGSPAARAGIAPGALVAAIDGRPAGVAATPADSAVDPRRLAWQRVSAVHRRLAGPAGEPVLVTVDRDGTSRTVRLERVPPPGRAVRFGNLPPVEAAVAVEQRRVDGRTIGVIRFNVWMPGIIPALDSAVDALREADAIVLDLRGNPGGVVGMAMGLAGQFLDSLAPLGTMRQRGNTLRVVAFPRRVDTRQRLVTPFAGPLAIVVDEQSFSTSEIFAAGLQGLGRAHVFGVTTGGQALPSVPEPLPSGDLLYHAIGDFTAVTGRPVEGPGVTPDVEVRLTRRALLAGEDPALDAAIRWGASAARAREPRPAFPSLSPRPFR
jgi:carboxyl-terminal processing protease